jgi:hypothetical protein
MNDNQAPPPPSAICGVNINQWTNMNTCAMQTAKKYPVCQEPSTECKALMQGLCSKYDSGKFTVSNYIDWNVCYGEALQKCKPDDYACHAKAQAKCCSEYMG